MCACEMVASCATKYNDGVHNVLSRVTRPHDVSVHHSRSFPVHSHGARVVDSRRRLFCRWGLEHVNMCSSAPSERATRAPQSCAVSLRRLVARITARDEHTISVVGRWPSREHNQGPPPGFKKQWVAQVRQRHQDCMVHVCM